MHRNLDRNHWSIDLFAGKSFGVAAKNWQRGEDEAEGVGGSRRNEGGPHHHQVETGQEDFPLRERILANQVSCFRNVLNWSEEINSNNSQSSDSQKLVKCRLLIVFFVSVLYLKKLNCFRNKKPTLLMIAPCENYMKMRPKLMEVDQERIAAGKVNGKKEKQS